MPKLKQLDLSNFIGSEDLHQCQDCRKMFSVKDLIPEIQLTYGTIYTCKKCHREYKDSIFREVNKEYLENNNKKEEKENAGREG